MSPHLLDLLPGKVSGNLFPIKKTWPLSTQSMVGHRRLLEWGGISASLFMYLLRKMSFSDV